MTRLLSLFGLNHPAIDNSTDWEAKYKQAVADLEKQAGEIAAAHHAKGEAVAMNKKLTESMALIERDRDHWRDQALREESHALAMRRKRQRDRDRRKGR